MVVIFRVQVPVGASNFLDAKIEICIFVDLKIKVENSVLLIFMYMTQTWIIYIENIHIRNRGQVCNLYQLYIYVYIYIYIFFHNCVPWRKSYYILTCICIIKHTVNGNKCCNLGSIITIQIYALLFRSIYWPFIW